MTIANYISLGVFFAQLLFNVGMILGGLKLKQLITDGHGGSNGNHKPTMGPDGTPYITERVCKLSRELDTTKLNLKLNRILQELGVDPREFDGQP